MPTDMPPMVIGDLGILINLLKEKCNFDNMTLSMICQMKMHIYIFLSMESAV